MAAVIIGSSLAGAQISIRSRTVLGGNCAGETAAAAAVDRLGWSARPARQIRRGGFAQCAPQRLTQAATGSAAPFLAARQPTRQELSAALVRLRSAQRRGGGWRSGCRRRDRARWPKNRELAGPI